MINRFTTDNFFLCVLFVKADLYSSFDNIQDRKGLWGGGGFNATKCHERRYDARAEFSTAVGSTQHASVASYC
jgi:hypothetical protein